MGLDMYLMGIDGLGSEYELAYWRKHPNLHGYIVNNFADGVDECQEIPLTAVDLESILKASEEDRLPDTQGFFFGTSQDEDKPYTKEAIEKVLEWLTGNEGRTAYYQASW